MSPWQQAAAAAAAAAAARSSLVSFDAIAMVGRCRTGMAFPDADGFGRGSDSAGFGRVPSSPAGIFLWYFTVCMGILTLQIWILDSDGFGQIPGPQTWKSPTQLQDDPRCTSG